MLLLLGILLAVVGLLGLVDAIPGLNLVISVILLVVGVCLALYDRGVFGPRPRV